MFGRIEEGPYPAKLDRRKQGASEALLDSHGLPLKQWRTENIRTEGRDEQVRNKRSDQMFRWLLGISTMGIEVLVLPASRPSLPPSPTRSSTTLCGGDSTVLCTVGTLRIPSLGQIPTRGRDKDSDKLDFRALLFTACLNRSRTKTKPERRRERREPRWWLLCLMHECIKACIHSICINPTTKIFLGRVRASRTFLLLRRCHHYLALGPTHDLRGFWPGLRSVGLG